MSEFKHLDGDVWASPQIDETDVEEAARQGFGLIINNRPDGEAEGQPSGSTIESAARAHGLAYLAIPVDHSGFSEPQVEAMRTALQQAKGKVLAYCRSGTRSTFLWALAKASDGDDPQALAGAARTAGYDLTPVAPVLDDLAAKARG